MDVNLKQEPRTPVSSAEESGRLAKAESWLALIADEVKEVGDQEALVYLRSRGRACHEQIDLLIESWKAAEQARIEEYNQDIGLHDLSAGSRRNTRKPWKATASNIESISPLLLRDFWDAPALGDQSTDATMLRTFKWCEISGFEPWWRRLAHERRERLYGGGMEEAASAAYWLFNMARSDYAIEFMPGVLKSVLEAISFSGFRGQRPWTTPEDSASPIEHHLAHASAVVFGHHRIPSPMAAPELLNEAVELLCKHQESNGGWRTLTTDAEVSIESTVMALHALSLAQPPGWSRIATRATNWLWSNQQEDGSWAESGVPGSVYLTVSVLDAIALANGTQEVTFARGLPRKATQDREIILSSGLSQYALGGPGEPTATSEKEVQPGTEPSTASQRRSAIDEFISKMGRAGLDVNRNDISTAAGYKDVTEFQRYQRASLRSTKTAARNFNRVLRMTPDEFQSALTRPKFQK
jgi:hypothetical protein